MIVQSFRSVMWVGAVAGAAIGCYMVSLRVASERARLESVETRILIAKRDIRGLDTELTTRGRLRQLERWNADVLALAPPTEGQFLQSEVQLAGLAAIMARDDAPDVRLASAAGEREPEESAKAIPAEYRSSDAPREKLLVRAAAPRRGLGEKAERKATKPAASLAASETKRAPEKAKASAEAKPKLAAKTPSAKTKALPAKRELASGDKPAVAKKAKASKAL